MRSKFYITLAFLIMLQLKNSFQNDWNQQDFQKKEHSFSKPYGGGGGVPYWDFVGSTIVTNKFVRLTADSQSLAGGIWNTLPVEMKDWEMQFQFNVHGHGKDLSGDGFAMWYAKDRNQIGPVFGSRDHFNGLAIFFDTYNNHNGPNNLQHPYISAMVNNGSVKYDHDTDGTLTALAGCESSFRNKEHDTFVAVRYQNFKLTVSTDIDNKNTWKECFSINNIRLPTRYYFGFSAATGDLSDNHDLISVKTYALDSERKFETIDSSMIEPSSDGVPQKVHPENEHQSTFWYILKIMFITVLIIALAGIVLYVSYIVYNRQRQSKKRFY